MPDKFWKQNRTLNNHFKEVFIFYFLFCFNFSRQISYSRWFSCIRFWSVYYHRLWQLIARQILSTFIFFHKWLKNIRKTEKVFFILQNEYLSNVGIPETKSGCFDISNQDHLVSVRIWFTGLTRFGLTRIETEQTVDNGLGVNRRFHFQNWIWKKSKKGKIWRRRWQLELQLLFLSEEKNSEESLFLDFIDTLHR
jgi:hypothetical protein